MQSKDNIKEKIIETVSRYYPDVQAIYLFGSYGTENEWSDSDVDIALLLPHNVSVKPMDLAMSTCRSELENFIKKDVDIVNVRKVSTVFQKEIIMIGRLLYCADRYKMDEFEMYVLSFYQKLNEERAEIIDSIIKDRRIYAI